MGSDYKASKTRSEALCSECICAMLCWDTASAEKSFTAESLTTACAFEEEPVVWTIAFILGEEWRLA
ncbi:hypothetical protein [Hoeflea sp.]|uniref:hypothetical protein n=1 Tax=Hoeflea sp. TaxID=1940281 RepID=UPI0025BBDBAB|nr:hypothetical protein [Hoeflea sp.]